MLVVIALFAFIGTQVMLAAMFPDSDVGGFMRVPASILATAVLLYLYYWIIDNIPALEKVSFVLGIFTLSGIVMLNIELHRQDGRPGVWQQLGSYAYVAQNYRSISCDIINEPIMRSRRNMKPGEIEKYVAAVHRCREIIPLDGSYALYSVKPRNASDQHFVITDLNEIPDKLDTGIERQFYRFLEWRYR